MPVLTKFDLAFLLLLLVVYFSFTLGYTRGCRRGKVEGRIEKMLDLKEKSLLLGQCTLCGYVQDYGGSAAKNGTIIGNSHG